MNKTLDNKLLRAEHYEYGIWYFTTIGKCATAIGVENSQVKYYLEKNRPFKGWNFMFIEDAGDVPYNWINPTRQDVLRNKEI